MPESRDFPPRPTKSSRNQSRRQKLFFHVCNPQRAMLRNICSFTPGMRSHQHNSSRVYCSRAGDAGGVKTRHPGPGLPLLPYLASGTLLILTEKPNISMWLCFTQGGKKKLALMASVERAASFEACRSSFIQFYLFCLTSPQKLSWGLFTHSSPMK